MWIDKRMKCGKKGGGSGNVCIVGQENRGKRTEAKKEKR
jgi:hypothetical protein